MSKEQMQDYECPRCGYQTEWRKNMKKHLIDKKKPCPNFKNLELTDEIKNTVLDFRRYFAPKKETVTNNSYNSTNYNNYISGVDTLEKLTSYLKYTKTSIMDINDFVEEQHQAIVDKMENDEFKVPHLIDSQKFLNLIDDMVKTDSNKHEEMNVVYDDMLDRINIYCDKEWTNYMIVPGLHRIIEILRSNYLNVYECYLYRKMFADKKMTNAYQLNEIRIKLTEYYKFLAIFNHKPYVYAEPIEYVVNNYKTEDPDEFRNYGMKLYNDTAKSLSKTDTSSTKKAVLDIIKRNHKVNLKRLNESVLELIKVDEEFKKSFLAL